MKKSTKLSLLSAGIIVLFIILDQILKIWVKTHLLLGEHISVIGDWFYLYFIENEGMAFGLSFGQNLGKLLLTVFRIFIVGFLIYYLIKLIKKDKADAIVVTVLSLIITGAVGNIIDSLFYGIIFNESTPTTLATLFPDGGGYAPVLYGRVVDMFYFPLFVIPDWFPIFSGEYFFPAIFNLADSCVTVGIILALIFYKRIFVDETKSQPIENQQK
ncbi:MAG: lipoprotein signal peptidase [Bacteroidales bacterium]|nr:lipoprotein signal peptidase [Bacteroidales bacterium]